MKLMESKTGADPSMCRLRIAGKPFECLLHPALLMFLILACLCVPRNLAQHPSGNGGSNGGFMVPPSLQQDPLYPGRGLPPGSEDPIMRERRIEALNAQRQKSMVDEANKLLRLTTELNAEVNGAHSKPLNSDQLRQVAAIEKLAKSIREKMSTPVGGNSPMLMPPSPIPMIGLP